MVNKIVNATTMQSIIMMSFMVIGTTSATYFGTSWILSMVA